MKDLRKLAKEYAQNTIDLESYRKSRSELIKGICAGEVVVKENEYLAPLAGLEEKLDDTTENMITQIVNQGADPKAATAASKARPTDQNNSSSPSTGKIGQKTIIIGSLVIVVLCIVILTTLLSPATKEEPPKTRPDNEMVNESFAGQNLIAEFMQQKNWTQGNLNSFVASWQQLSSQEHEATHASPEMKRLTNAIYRQLLDKRALISLGDVENSVANQKMLVNFTERLGVDDKRFTVVEPEPELNPEIAPDQAAADFKKKLTETSVNSTSEPEDEIKKDLFVDSLESQSIAAEIPPESVPALDDKIETTATAITEAQDSVQEPSIKEIIATKTNAEQSVAETIVQKPIDKAACNSSLIKSRKPFCRDEIEDLGYGPTMVVIPGGNFTMGGKDKKEQPAHAVTIGSHFAMSVHEISFGEYEQYCLSTNSSCPTQPWSGKDYPVVNITHSDSTLYVEWLSQMTGQTYRLPSEAEWEYAARAGTKTTYPFGDEILITDAVFSDQKTLSAPLPKSDRSINRNKFRLYHMVGNVREWVIDTWYEGYSGAPVDGSARVDAGVDQFVVRGGSYTDSSEALRSGAREQLSSADNYTGFRVLQELSE
jgi:formylglycine-generating enzyme required for sulfatase activity